MHAINMIRFAQLRALITCTLQKYWTIRSIAAEMQDDERNSMCLYTGTCFVGSAGARNEPMRSAEI